MTYGLEIDQVTCFLKCPKLIFLQINAIRQKIESLDALSQLERLEFLIVNFLNQVNIESAPQLVDSLREVMPNTMIIAKFPKVRNERYGRFFSFFERFNNTNENSTEILHQDDLPSLDHGLADRSFGFGSVDELVEDSFAGNLGDNFGENLEEIFEEGDQHFSD
ncbi:hypothetical protein RCL1_009135 [Eukaryota sp. TZLM3-RCL]